MSYRVYTAVIRAEQILMVRHQHDGRDYWTLPGGKIEAGESPREAAAREVLEETGIRLEDLSELYVDGQSTCFLGTGCDRASAVLGSDPELPPSQQILVDVRWFDLEMKREDVQVRMVIAALARSG